MSRKNVILTTAFVLIAVGLYGYVYRDSFRRPVILISHTHERAARRKPTKTTNADTTPHPTFVMAETYRLTSVKVVMLDQLKAKGVALPLWELVTKSNSAPVKIFSYGRNISGMQPAVSGVPPEPLTNNVTYRLLVEAGKVKGYHDFTLTDEEYPDNGTN